MPSMPGKRLSMPLSLCWTWVDCLQLVLVGLALEVLLNVTVSKLWEPQYLFCSDSTAVCAAAVATSNLAWFSIGTA